MGILEFIVSDLCGFNPQASEHFRAGLDHHGRPAKIKFHGRRLGVAAKIFRLDDLVDKAGQAIPPVFRERRGKRRIKLEIRMGSRVRP